MNSVTRTNSSGYPFHSLNSAWDTSWPLSRRASLVYAEALLESGEPGKAEQQLAGILRDRPDHASANGLMAKVMLARGDFEQAGYFLERCTDAPDRRPPHLSTRLYFLNFAPRLSPIVSVLMP